MLCSIAASVAKPESLQAEACAALSAAVLLSNASKRPCRNATDGKDVHALRLSAQESGSSEAIRQTTNGSASMHQDHADIASHLCKHDHAFASDKKALRAKKTLADQQCTPAVAKWPAKQLAMRQRLVLFSTPHSGGCLTIVGERLKPCRLGDQVTRASTLYANFPVQTAFPPSLSSLMIVCAVYSSCYGLSAHDLAADECRSCQHKPTGTVVPSGKSKSAKACTTKEAHAWHAYRGGLEMLTSTH